MNLEFSLDCELVWGISLTTDPKYIETNVAKSSQSLELIVSKWPDTSPSLYLVFVAATIIDELVSEDKLIKLADEWGEEVVNSRGNVFYDHSRIRELSNKNVKHGLHGAFHDFYIDFSAKQLKTEMDSIVQVSGVEGLNSMFVYPKNLADSVSIERYSDVFDKIRVNCSSWLYRTNILGVSKVKRIIRYLDSFLPIYELFCKKTPEHSASNCVVGTHFYRANLSGLMLQWHIARLKMGYRYLRMTNEDMHIWSHPHNFGAKKDSIDGFHSLSRMAAND